MDPVTLAIVAAVTAGVTTGAGKIAEKVIVDAYEGLKGLIKKKFGQESKVVKAITDLEGEPDFEPYETGLKHRFEAAKVNEDHEILRSAKALLEKLEEKPEGVQVIHNIQKVYGDYSAVAGPYGTATVNVDQSKK